MTEKEEFVKEFKKRTKKFAGDVIIFCNSLVSSPATSVVTYQLIKAASSTGANYRAACRARSQAEFFSKMCIVVEESDESEYWLELIHDTNLSNEHEELNRLTNEASEILKVVASAKNTMYKTKAETIPTAMYEILKRKFSDRFLRWRNNAHAARVPEERVINNQKLT